MTDYLTLLESMLFHVPETAVTRKPDLGSILGWLWRSDPPPTTRSSWQNLPLCLHTPNPIIGSYLGRPLYRDHGVATDQGSDVISVCVCVQVRCTGG